ncbi:MAG: hypothetical protein ACK56F_32910, partial [bacterium]
MATRTCCSRMAPTLWSDGQGRPVAGVGRTGRTTPASGMAYLQWFHPDHCQRPSCRMKEPQPRRPRPRCPPPAPAPPPPT